MIRTPPLAAFVLWAAVTAPVALHAQVTDSTRRDSTAVTLKEIEVVGSIAPTAGPAIGSGIPARISTVTGEAIEAWEPRLLADALATQPGISLYDDLGSAYKLNLSTRGFNVGPVVGLPPGVSVFLDGVRQNEPDAAEVNFDLLPMEHVRRVELLSGSGSLLGANSLGGAINLITRRGTGPLEGELELSGGSYGAASAEGSLSGLTAGKTDYYVAGGYEREDGWRKATGAHNYNLFTNVGRRGEHRGISVQAFGAKSRARDGRLAAREHLRRLARDQLHHRRLRGYRPAAGHRLGVRARGEGTRHLHDLRAPLPRRAVQRQPGPGRQRPLAHHQRHGRRQPRLALDRSARRWRVLAPDRGRCVGQPGAHPALHREPRGRRRPHAHDGRAEPELGRGRLHAR